MCRRMAAVTVVHANEAIGSDASVVVRSSLLSDGRVGKLHNQFPIATREIGRKPSGLAVLLYIPYGTWAKCRTPWHHVLILLKGQPDKLALKIVYLGGL